MGKATRWFRGLFGLNRSNPKPNPNPNPNPRRRWSLVKSYREKENKSSSNFNDVTATDTGGLVTSAIVIQSYFRGYLARRALGALKGLVKLQALVRGHIMRRRTAETMRCMQSMLRAQARARSVRAYVPESSHSSSKSSQLNHAGPPTPEKFEQIVRAKSSRQHQSSKIRRNLSRPRSRGNLCSSSWSGPHIDEPMWNLPGVTSARAHVANLRKSQHPFDQTLNPLKLTQQFDDDNGLSNCTAENSSQCCSATKSDGSRSFLSGISDCPSYMSLTESSKAKMRSMSVPKQRYRYNPRPNAAVHTSFASKAYPGSGRLGRLGMPLKDSTVVYYSGYLN